MFVVTLKSFFVKFDLKKFYSLTLLSSLLKEMFERFANVIDVKLFSTRKQLFEFTFILLNLLTLFVIKRRKAFTFFAVYTKLKTTFFIINDHHGRTWELLRYLPKYFLHFGVIFSLSISKLQQLQIIYIVE